MRFIQALDSALSIAAITVALAIPLFTAAWIAGTVAGDGGYTHQVQQSKWSEANNAWLKTLEK